MRLIYQFLAFILLVLGALGYGLTGLLSPDELMSQYYQISLQELAPATRLGIHTHIRLLSSLWLVAAVMVFRHLRDFSRHGLLFRLVSLSFILGGFAELASAIHVDTPKNLPALKALLQLIIFGSLELWRTRLAKDEPGRQVQDPASSS